VQDGYADLSQAEHVFPLKYFLSARRDPVDERAVLHEHGVLLDGYAAKTPDNTAGDWAGSWPDRGGHGPDRA
jgi:hypothetical protein